MRTATPVVTASSEPSATLTSGPILIGLGVAGMFLLVLVIVGANRGAPKTATPAAETESSNARSATKNIPGMLSEAGIVTPDTKPQPAFGTARGPAPVTAQGKPTPAPTVVPASRPPTLAEQELEKLQQNRLQQLVQSAKAKTSVPVTLGSGTPTVPYSPDQRSPLRAPVALGGDVDPQQAYRARLAQLQSSGMLGSSGTMAGGAGAGGLAGGGGKKRSVTVRQRREGSVGTE